MNQIMATNIEEINAVIDSVRQERDLWISRGRDISMVGAFHAYDTAIDNMLDVLTILTATNELKSEIADTLTDYCTFRVRRGEAIRFHHSQKVLAVLRDQELLQKTLSHNDGARSVAWICMYNAYFHEQYKARDSQQVLHNFLNAWAGQGLKNPVHPKLVDVAAILFGGHASAAGLLEFEYGKELIQDMWDANSPVITKKTTQPSADLPGDLSL